MTRIYSCICILLLSSACELGSSAAPSSTATQWQLPKAFREVSGLAKFKGYLLAVADEKAKVLVMRWDDPSISYTYSVGEPTVKGDFEGIAVAGEDIFLVTSSGLLLRHQLGAADERVEYQAHKTKVGKHCEVEGLSQYRNHLLLACKKLRKAGAQGTAAYAWSLVTQALEPTMDLKFSGPALSYSGITPVPETDHWLLIAARERQFVVLDQQGNALRRGKLPDAAQHPQAEGVVASDGITYIADEARDRKRATLTRYDKYL